MKANNFIDDVTVIKKDERKEETDWWKDKDFINKLDKDFAEWDSGKTNGYTLEEVNASLNKLQD